MSSILASGRDCANIACTSAQNDNRLAAQFFRVDALTKRFGGLTAVNAVSFELSRDQIVGLIGPNGAGKTTLLRLITKILRPDSGRIVFQGEDITGLRPWEIVQRGIAESPARSRTRGPSAICRSSPT